MSNKARSRKQKQELKDIRSWSKRISKVVSSIVSFRMEIQKLKESKYPKLASGGTVYKGTSNQLIHGGEMIVPYTGFKGATPYDNEPFLFQFND